VPERQLDKVRRQLAEQSRALIEFRQEADHPVHHLVRMHQLSSWRLTYPFRLVRRIVQFLRRLQHLDFSNGSILISSGFKLLFQTLTELDLAKAIMHHADANLRSEITQTVRTTPTDCVALSALGQCVEKGYRKLRATGRRLLRSSFVSGATWACQELRQRGVYFHLDKPLGIVVPTRRAVMFRGWALDTNTKNAAEVRVFAGGQPVRVDRYKRADVTAAFGGQVSKGAKTAFEARVPLTGRSTWVRIELASAPDRWDPVHRALLRLVGHVEATEVRSKRTGDLAEWFDVLQDHLAAQIDEMREHIDTMVLRPAFLVVIDARKSKRDFDVTIGSLRAQIYRAAGVAVLRRDRPDDGNSGVQLVRDVSDETVQWVDHLDVCDPLFAHLDYLLFIEPGDRFVPSALYSFASEINREPTSALIYADELFRTSSGAPLPFHKPAWSPDYLESFDYIGHSGVFSMARARQLSLPFTSVYDFTLRFTESLGHDRVVHLDSLLFERAASFASKMFVDDDVAAIRGRLERTGRSGVIVPAPSGTNCYHARVRWERTPEISILIPTAGYTKLIDGRDIDLIVNVTQQIVERSTYRSAEIIVVDNGDLNEGQTNHLAKLGCRRVTFKEQAFNIAKKLNLGASVAKGELLLLMNDDIEIVQGDWIERLCDHMAKPDVGVVGCKLLYPDRSIQHVGVFHYQGNPDHVRRGYPADDAGYFNSTCGVRNYLAVTGACMLTRKALYQQLGGYAPQLAVSYNDTDFCLNVRAAGYRVVYTGDVVLIHMKSLSCVPSAIPDEVRYYHERWTPELPQDPFYNERFLTLDPPSFEPRTNDRLL
jgi:O-antigen biosynthesis protein